MGNFNCSFLHFPDFLRFGSTDQPKNARQSSEKEEAKVLPSLKDKARKENYDRTTKQEKQINLGQNLELEAKTGVKERWRSIIKFCRRKIPILPKKKNPLQ